MHLAVENMKVESRQCFIFFIVQLFFFHISSFLLMWTLYSTTVAIVINAILMVFLVVFVINGFDIYNKLHVKDEDAAQGTF